MSPRNIKTVTFIRQELEKEMATYGTSIEGGFVLCRPCAVNLGYLPARQDRCCPYSCNGPPSKFENCPWRKHDRENLLALVHTRYEQLVQDKLADLATFPDSERNAKAHEIAAEVTQKYHPSWYKACEGQQ